MPPPFEPEPENDFRDFVALYYTACRQRFPCISAIADKTCFEDLVPGLSDVYQLDNMAPDTRLPSITETYSASIRVAQAWSARVTMFPPL